MKIRKDEIGFGNYSLLQDAEGFCYGIDAVLLADFSCAKHSDTVLELGSGSGVVSLIIEAKYSPKSIDAVEKYEPSFNLAQKNFEENGLSEKIKVYNLDVKNLEMDLPKREYTLIVSNPPYMEQGRGPKSSGEADALARVESTATLEDFISVSAKLLKRGGRLCLVHRPSRLADICELSRKYGLEPKRLRMVAPHAGEKANIMLIECVKGAGKELTVLPELAVRCKDGSYTDEINKIYCR